MRNIPDYRQIVRNELKSNSELPLVPDRNHLDLIKAQLEREVAASIGYSIYFLNSNTKSSQALSWSESIARNSSQNITGRRIRAEYFKILKKLKREQHDRKVLLNKLRRLGVADPEQMLDKLYAPGSNLKLMREHLSTELQLRSYESWEDLVDFVIGNTADRPPSFTFSRACSKAFFSYLKKALLISKSGIN